MILICEPQCKGISHEKVNSGFLYGFHLAYPKEKIVFFAEKTHFQEVKNIFIKSHVATGSIENFPINFSLRNNYGFGGIVRYYLLFKRIFDKACDLGINKIFFLSTSPIILYTIKILKQKSKYKNICCSFVLHGELEDISHKNYEEPYTTTLKGVKIGFNRALATLFNHPNRVFLFILGKIFWPVLKLYSNYSLIFKKKLRVKKMMMWQHSDQYNYISLSPHVTKNASKYIDVKHLNIHTIIMPIIFAKPYRTPDNKYIKFAVFGYGDSGQMQKMLSILSKRHIKNTYEIRIISMDDRGIEGFPNVTHVGSGNVLTVNEMENSAKDIDMFINLYDRTRHRFGCSLSIFEAFSYLKPVLHLSNPGYNYFNNKKKPIGYRTENLNEFVNKMCDMIENYSKYEEKLEVFRKNMLAYRKEYNIKSNLLKLRKTFTFNNNNE